MPRSMPTFTPKVEYAVWGAVRLAMKVTRDPLHTVLDPQTHAKDPYAAYASLRDRGGILKGRFPKTYVTTTHASADHVLKRHHVGARPGDDVPAWMTWDSPLSPSLLDLDPPDHTRIRRLVSQAFTPRAIKSLRERAYDVAGSLLDAVADEDRVDLIDVYASRLPLTMICGMLGVPDENQERFLAWGEDIALSLEPRRTPSDQRRIDASGEALATYFRGHFDRRREALERGDAPDDILTNLLRAEEGQDHLSERELVATCILLLGAGFETTVNLIGNAVLALSRHPEQREFLATGGPDHLPLAVEEFLRYDAPVQFTGRVVWDDDVIDGVEVQRGGTILTLLGAANRDPAVFARPDELDVTRVNAREHLSFSAGPHHCLGAALARLEAEVALEVLLERHPGVGHIAAARRRSNTVLRGLSSLPVALR